jgi:integrase
VQKPGGFTAGERTLSDDEICKLWHGLPQALAKSKACQRIIKICLITGQRLGEVSGMTRTELDLDRKLWSLPGSRTNNGVLHTVPLSDLAVKLAGLTDADGASNFTPHALRHFAGSLWLAEGMTLKDVSWRLGHKTTIMTENIYHRRLYDLSGHQ